MSQTATMPFVDHILDERGMIVFQNKGLIDPMAITTFGLNAKVGDSPIGQFGTGLKYAIAVLLRTGHEITIWRGLEPLRFDVIEHETRGKLFNIVRMNGEKLSFMTNLGPKWELWMAFRELFCNAKDEGDDGRLEEGEAIVK